MATTEQFVEEVIGNAVEGATASDPAAPQTGAFINAMESMPGLPTATAFTMQRGANTILGGGWGGVDPSNATQGSIRNNNPFRKRTWNRYGSQSIFFEGNRGPQGQLHGGFGRKGKSSAYSPFQFGANVANKISGKRGMAVDRGALSRFTASARLGHMNAGAFGKASPHVDSFLKGTRGMPAYQQRQIMAAGPKGAQHAMLRGMQGRVTGFMGGFASEAIGGIDDLAPRARSAINMTSSGAADRGAALAKRWGSEVGEQTLRGARRTAVQGASGAGKWAARQAGTSALASTAGKKVALGAAKFAMSRTAAYAIPYAGQALLLYDLARMGTSLAGSAIKGTVKTASEGFKSFQGGINTGPMEQGFKDNEVTMTSRSRGVMAIQNSRLNARSALGAEAGAMASHFG